VDVVNADSVVDYLFAAEVLSDVDFDLLTDISEKTSKTRKLMAILHKGKTSRSIYQAARGNKDRCSLQLVGGKS
jgi:hypothetical protein